jgi:hypothetical protein
MSDFSDWLQNNGIDLARLAVQGAILAVVVSYGRKLLKTLRASQEQVGALLKLSVSDTSAQQATPAAVTESEPSLEASSRTTFESEREHSLGGRVLRESGAVAVAEEEPPAFTPWIAAPSTESQRVEVPQHVEVPQRVDLRPPQMARSGNPISRWLQAPIRRPGVRRVSPWRKMVQWLQAPAGN